MSSCCFPSNLSCQQGTVVSCAPLPPVKVKHSWTKKFKLLIQKVCWVNKGVNAQLGILESSVFLPKKTDSYLGMAILTWQFYSFFPLHFPSRAVHIFIICHWILRQPTFCFFTGSTTVNLDDHHHHGDDQGGPQLAGPYQAIRQTASTSRCRVRAHTALLVPSSTQQFFVLILHASCQFNTIVFLLILHTSSQFNTINSFLPHTSYFNTLQDSQFPFQHNGFLTHTSYFNTLQGSHSACCTPLDCKFFQIILQYYSLLFFNISRVQILQCTAFVTSLGRPSTSQVPQQLIAQLN